MYVAYAAVFEDGPYSKELRVKSLLTNSISYSSYISNRQNVLSDTHVCEVAK